MIAVERGRNLALPNSMTDENDESPSPYAIVEHGKRERERERELVYRGHFFSDFWLSLFSMFCFLNSLPQTHFYICIDIIPSISTYIYIYIYMYLISIYLSIHDELCLKAVW
jgi:hypothetical protein